jgi:hypothetical protein
VRYQPTGQLWIDDHKFNKDIPSDKMLELDDQFGLYTWGLKQLGMPVVGCIYNCLRTQRNKSKPQSLDERFKRIMLYRTDEELAIIALEAYATAKRAWSRGPLDDSIAPGTDAERNPNSDTCRWRCPFTEDCLGGRKGYDMRRSLKLHGFEQNFERH